MTEAEADATLAFLQAAGVVPERVAYCVWDGRPYPPETDLTVLYPEDWDAAFTLVWVVLPSTDPRAAKVDEARDRFFADPAYAKALEEAHNREELWEVPG